MGKGRMGALGFGLGLALAVAACGGRPLADAEAALAAKDLPRAEAALDAGLKDHPGLKAVHMERFVLFRYQQAQGDPAAQQAYLRKVEDEYAWLVRTYQLSENYADMDSSFKSKPDAAADYAEAHHFLYGD